MASTPAQTKSVNGTRRATSHHPMSDGFTERLEELLGEVALENRRLAQLEYAIQWSEAYREDAIASIVRLKHDALVLADTSPLTVSMMRGDIARAVRSVRRAGRMLRELALPTEHLLAALHSLRLALAALPKELPKPNGSAYR